jgi:O-methyltransferase
VEEEGMADRIEFRVGDLFEIDLGTGHDIAMANSIVHHFSPEENVRMLRRARGALRSGGTMAVLELDRPAPGKCGTQLGTLTGVLFYVTSRARTYTGAEIAEFFEQAGFSNVRQKRHPRLSGQVLVVGHA